MVCNQVVSCAGKYQVRKLVIDFQSGGRVDKLRLIPIPRGLTQPTIIGTSYSKLLALAHVCM